MCKYIRVCRLAEEVSAPRSLPARSMSENLPCTRCMPGDRTMIWNTACDRELFELADVCNHRNTTIYGH